MWNLLLPLLGDVLDKIIPDPQAAAAAKLEALKLAQAGQLAELDVQTKLALAQIDNNKADAQGASPMQRNWRPAIGWVCAAALAWDTIVRPILTFGMAYAGHQPPTLPTLSSEQLYSLLFGLLGLGGLRTVEKVKGAAQ
jgi:hypothetical protein